MADKKTLSFARLPNARAELQRAIQRAERGLTAASAEGFREVPKRVREAILGSERLVVVLDQLVRQGFRRRQSAQPAQTLSSSEVAAAGQAVRAAVGCLAKTTPLRFSSDYKKYTEGVRALMAVAESVLEGGVEPLRVPELDEWKPFRER